MSVHSSSPSGGLSVAAFMPKQSVLCPSGFRESPQGILKEAQTMTDAANPSGLTDEEAQEFHTYYVQGYLLWAAGAFFAHSLVWIWRPWF
jgi:light-harvesting complex 1 beta chain